MLVYGYVTKIVQTTQKVFRDILISGRDMSLTCPYHDRNHCIYIYIYILSIHIYTVYIYIYVCMCMYVCMYVCVCVQVHTLKKYNQKRPPLSRPPLKSIHYFLMIVIMTSLQWLIVVTLSMSMMMKT